MKAVSNVNESDPEENHCTDISDICKIMDFNGTGVLTKMVRTKLYFADFTS